MGNDSQAVLMAEELAQEIRRQEARAKREAAELAAQQMAVHSLSNRERSQITTVYNAFKNKQTGASVTRCQRQNLRRVLISHCRVHISFKWVCVSSNQYIFGNVPSINWHSICAGELPGYHLKTLFVALGVKIRTRAIREMLKKLNKISTDPGGHECIVKVEIIFQNRNFLPIKITRKCIESI